MQSYDYLKPLMGKCFGIFSGYSFQEVNYMARKIDVRRILEEKIRHLGHYPTSYIEDMYDSG